MKRRPAFINTFAAAGLLASAASLSMLTACPCNGCSYYGETGTWLDADHDGFDDHAHDGEDCDDTDPTVHPAAEEVCDSVDNDCDGEIDEGSEAIEWFLDKDNDGFGKLPAGRTSCRAPEGARWAPNDTDCDDSDNAVNPSAPELCDGIDNDCDDGVDEGC